VDLVGRLALRLLELSFRLLMRCRSRLVSISTEEWKVGRVVVGLKGDDDSLEAVRKEEHDRHREERTLMVDVEAEDVERRGKIERQESWLSVEKKVREPRRVNQVSKNSVGSVLLLRLPACVAQSRSH